jgi:hypothetical protein
VRAAPAPAATLAALALLAALVPAGGLAAPASGDLLRNGNLDAWALGASGLCPAWWRCSLPPSLGAVAPSPLHVSAPTSAALAEVGWIQQDVSASAGLTYALSLMYQHPQAGTCMAVIRLLFHDAEGNFLERPTDHVMEQVDAWRGLTLPALAPPGTASATVHLASGCLASPPGMFLVDDVRLVAQP